MTGEEAIDRVAQQAARQMLLHYNPPSDKEPAFTQLVAFYKRHWREHPRSFPFRQVGAMFAIPTMDLRIEPPSIDVTPDSVSLV